MCEFACVKVIAVAVNDHVPFCLSTKEGYQAWQSDPWISYFARGTVIPWESEKISAAGKAFQDRNKKNTRK